MSNENNISSRIEILRFPLIVGVIFIHNYASTVQLAQGSVGVEHSSGWVDFIRFFISQGVARVAVPLFFMISGYLFFLGQWSWEGYVGKLKRRVHTLLIPFIFWNLVLAAIYALEYLIPQAQRYQSGAARLPVHSSLIFSYIDGFFGLTVIRPLSYQFWFIRDLMALVVLAPAIHFVLARRSALPFVAGLFCLWFLTIWPVLWPSVEATFFFALGAYLSRPEKSVTRLDKFGPWISVIFLGLLFFYSAFPDSHLNLQNSAVIFGTPAIWWLTGLAVRNTAIRSSLMRLSGDSFFVFAAHEPLLRITRKVSFDLLVPTSGLTILALYFLIPIGLIAFLVMVHRCLLITTPSFVGLITGSSYRSNKAKEPLVQSPL